MGFPLSVLCSGRPLNWISHIFWLKLLKPFFCDLKSKFPLILKINISGSMGMEDLSSDITYDPVSFHWTVPLNVAMA
jgi:hypothetical protein